MRVIRLDRCLSKDKDKVEIAVHWLRLVCISIETITTIMGAKKHEIADKMDMGQQISWAVNHFTIHHYNRMHKDYPRFADYWRSIGDDFLKSKTKELKAWYKKRRFKTKGMVEKK